MRMELYSRTGYCRATLCMAMFALAILEPANVQSQVIWTLELKPPVFS